MALHEIRFADLPEQEEISRQHLRDTRARLEARKYPNPAEQAELARVKRVIQAIEADDTKKVDPLFVAIDMMSPLLTGHQNGVLTFGGEAVSERFDQRDALTVRVSFILGLLYEDRAPGPRVVVDARGAIVSDITDPVLQTFTRAFYAALGEAEGLMQLAGLVLAVLQDEGDPDRTGGRRGEVRTIEFARVMRCLAQKGVTADRPQQLRRRVNECLDSIQAVGVDKSVADMGIALPDLNTITAYQIQKRNVEAMGPMICAAMFDELKAFDVLDTILYQWQQGTLPIDVSPAGRMLYDYWKSAPNRMSEAERRGLYALTMGIPGGSVNGNGSVNRDFNDLWMRFVSSVSTLVRQKTVDQLLRQSVPSAIHQQQVRKAARDLASNLSRYAFGIVNYAARDLQDQINKMIELLNHEDIRRSFGARDMWQVIDQVATLELGGARNSARFRTLASCGAIITKWLAQNVEKYNNASGTPVIDLIEVTSSDPKQSDEPTKTPTDYDLVNACELWLADTAVSDDQIDEISRRPREAPAMTSRPVQIPSIARELIEQSLPGMSLGTGTPRY